MNLSIGICTARNQPRIDWMVDSLVPQFHSEDNIEIIVCDGGLAPGLRTETTDTHVLRVVEPKPNPWIGRHRWLKDQWWGKCAQINTIVCLARHEWLLMLDDRCVVRETSLDAVRGAVKGNYAVAGSYEKRHNMKVEKGKIIDGGTLDGSDPRSPGGQDHRGFNSMACGGGWWFGCCNALPVEWMLQINGAPECLDGSSHEDCIIGGMLERNRYPMIFDPRLFVTQDRTPGQCGPDIRRSSRERHPHDRYDRVHSALRRYQNVLCSPHHINLRAIREAVQRGEPFPSVDTYPTNDWWDGKPIKEWDSI